MAGEVARPITVGHVVPGPWLAQTQTWLYEQVRRLPGHVQGHVFCESTENLDQFPFPRIHSLACSRGRRLDPWLRKLRLRRHWGFVARELGSSGADLLHSHFGWIGWENCRLARRLGIRHVVTFYGLDVNYLPRQGWGARYPELFDLVDRVLCEGPHMARCIVALGCPQAKVRVHHLGVSVDELEFRPRVWDEGPLRVLLAASFREKKGLPFALEALARVRDEIDLQITVIGDAGPGPSEQDEKRRILAVIAEGGLGPRTRMLGYQPHRRLLQEAYRHHVFLSPSVTAASGDTEGGAPVGLIEMAATGMAIVSTRHCDIPEVVVDGETGLLADERDPGGLAELIRRLASKRSSWRPMLEAGRKHIEHAFHSGRQGVRLAQAYAEVLAQ